MAFDYSGVRLKRVVSGGQTGVDRAALDAARDCGLPFGGWCPRGRRADDGTIPDKYPLSETPSRGYRQRTSWNVRDSDATLVLVMNGGILVAELTGGTKLTAEVATRLKKPCLVFAVNTCAPPAPVLYWLSASRPGVLNVAGPRESSAPGIYRLAYGFLVEVLTKTRP